MAFYSGLYTSLFSQLEGMEKGSAILDCHKALMLPAFIDKMCGLMSTAAALRTKDVSELTRN